MGVASEAVRVERDVMVEMRDGIRLATDIYLPSGPDAPTGPLPVILERTPYDKQGISRSEVSPANRNPATRAALAAYFASRGYAVVMQDCRGRYRSEGVFTKYINEADDGLDTMKWLIAQPFCNGSVGTMGLSYGAHTQCALASLGPPGLACMFMDSGGFSSAYHGGIRRGGAFELKQATWAYRHALLSPATAADPRRDAALRQRDIRDWFRDMPWRPGYSPLSAAPEYESYLFEQWRESRFSEYWKRPGLYAEGFYDEFPDVPTAIIGSWYDPYAEACIRNFTSLRARKKSEVMLLMGPWTHGDRSQTWSGDVDFGPAATLDGNIAPDYRQFRLAWFDRCLKGADAADVPPRVRWFRMGGGSGTRDGAGRLQHGGEWQSADDWPPADAEMRPLYLHADGRLDDVAGPADESLSYRFDPADPVPTIGGALTSGEPVMRGGAFDQCQTDRVFACSRDRPNGPLANRQDVLVFQTAPLQSPVVVSGTVRVELYVSSDCPDTDFTAKLIDVYPPSADNPDGFAMNVSDGIFRMRCREGWDRETSMEPGRIYRIDIEAFVTSNLFNAGHRIRVDISSSNYPQFDLNPNTGVAAGWADRFQVATNRVHIGGSHASRLWLQASNGGGPDR